MSSAKRKILSTSCARLGTILETVVSNGFIQKCAVNKNDLLKIGPTGLLLVENLRREWFYSMVLNKDVMVFMNNQKISDTLDYAKKTCSETLPFGIAEIIESSPPLSQQVNDFSNFFSHEENKLLKCTIFVAPKDSTQFFHQWQKQRRMWWRRFSANPGIYTLTNIKNSNDELFNVEVVANYSWGQQLLENIVLNKVNDTYTKSQLQFKQGRTQVKAHTVTSNIHLPTMFLNSICDVYDESNFQNKTRILLRFHRKLAPYQISMALSASNAAATSELKDLALYLSRLLKTNHISTLYVPNSYKSTLEAQFMEYDRLGVPYTVIMNENTLVNGICQLRSRDITLKEQVHVNNLVSYVEQLFKNY